MSKEKFLAELRGYLKRLPEEEIESAMRFYEEYFYEAGDETEAAEKLGSPRTVAAKIIGEYALNDDEEKPERSALKAVWVVLLAIFASPIALPIALAVFIIILSLLIVIVSVVFSVAVTALALGLSGIVAVIAGVILLFGHFATALFIMGYGLFSIGLCICVTKGTFALGKLSMQSIRQLLGKILIRRSAV